MDKKDLFDALDEFYQNLYVTLAEVDLIKASLRSLVEENIALRLENDKLRERLGAEDPFLAKTGKKGRENLQKIYKDGFHVCKEYYGQRREDDEECMFCRTGYVED